MIGAAALGCPERQFPNHPNVTAPTQYAASSTQWPSIVADVKLVRLVLLLRVSTPVSATALPPASPPHCTRALEPLSKTKSSGLALPEKSSGSSGAIAICKGHPNGEPPPFHSRGAETGQVTGHSQRDLTRPCPSTARAVGKRPSNTKLGLSAL